MEYEIECQECSGKGGFFGYNPYSEDGAPERWSDCPECGGKGVVPRLKGKIVAIDFDGVISRYDGWKGIDDLGFDSLGANGLIEDLLESGADVWVYTTRLNEYVNKGYTVQELTKKIADWLNYNKYPDRLQVYNMPGKPIADLYIDDRAYRHTTNATWFQDEVDEVFKILESD